MLRATIALLVRSLREDSRSVRQHLLRLGLAVFILAMLWYAQETSRFLGAPGRTFFSSLVFTEVFFICLIAANYFAVAITEEKEERTLGLLRMADISPLTLLLGKTLPRLWTVLLLLVMQLPFTLLAVTLGGLNVRHVLAAHVAVGAFTILVAGIAVLCSVMIRRSSHASWMSAILIFLVLAGPSLGLGILSAQRGGFGVFDRNGPISSGLEWMQQHSVFGRLAEVLGSTFSGSIFGTQTLLDLGCGLVLLVIAWAVFDRFAVDSDTVAEQRPLFSFSRKRRASRAWTSNPFAWKDFVFLAGGTGRLFWRMILYPVVILAVFAPFNFGNQGVFDPEYLGPQMIIGVLWIGFFELGSLAGRVLREEVRWNTLQSLMLVPENTSHIFYSKLLGYLIALVPAVFYFGVGCLLNPPGVFDFFEDVLSEPEAMIGIFAVVTLFVFYLHVGAYLSLYLKWGAMAAAFVSVYMVMMMILMCGMRGIGGPDGFVGFGLALSILGWVLIASMHALIAARLTALAAK